MTPKSWDRYGIHVIEPGQLGGGVYSAAQPDYLILNNPCGQLSLYAAPDHDEDPAYAVGLYDGRPIGIPFDIVSKATPRQRVVQAYEL